MDSVSNESGTAQRLRRASVTALDGVGAPSSGHLNGVAEVEQLYAAHSLRLERMVGARLRLAPQPLIEDACQVAWSRLLRRPDRVHRDTALAWLVTTALHEAARLAYRHGREASLEAELAERGDDALPGLVPGPDQVVEDRELLGRLRRLPDRQRRLLWLHALGMKYVEIAGVEGCSERTVERQIIRARRRLGPATTR